MELTAFRLVFLVLQVVLVRAQENARCRKNVDIGFLLDSSGSIGDSDYIKEKEFVKSLAETFSISSRETQAGLIIYSDDARMYARFGEYPDIDSFKRAVDSLPYFRKRTRIDKALKLAADELFTVEGGARPDKEDIMVILTDGVQTTDPDAISLSDAVRPLKNANVHVFAVGIGSHYMKSELLQLASENDVYEAKDFDELLELVAKIAQGTCAPSPVLVPKCRYRADLGFIMDASNSIAEDNFQKERDFVNSLAAAYTFGPRETAAAVITYSDEAILDIPLGSHYSSEGFRQSVDRIPYTLGRTRIDKALKLASTDVFSARGGSRPGFPKLMVILTDGVQTPDPDAIPLYQAVIPLQDKGVTVFAVGVGSRIDKNQLRQMVQRDDEVFTATDFDDLLRKAYEISERTCEDVKSQIEVIDGGWSAWQPWDTCTPKCGGGAQNRQRVCDSPPPQNSGLYCIGPSSQTRACNQQPCQGEIKCTARADIGFVMDASASIGERDFQKERDFVKALAGSFTFAPDQTLVGVITYSDDATIDIPLGRYMSPERFKLAVDQIPYILGRTRIDKAIKLAATGIFSEQGGSRPGYPKLMVILTDGVQTRDPDAIPLDQAVIPLRNAGVRIFAVGVGSYTNESELRLMTNNVFTAKDFDDLLKMTYQIAQRTCEGIVEKPVDGSWSSWQEWNTCVPQCGGGRQTRQRACTKPSPAHGGRQCPGVSSETRACNQQPCVGEIKCTARADIGFVMDASASIGERDFQKERDFVKALAGSFTFAPDQTLVGVITYSDDATIDIPLGRYMSTERFKLAVDQIPYILGRTRIDKAIKLAATGIFSKQGGSRPGYPKLMVILTDGVQTRDPDAISLDQAVIPLRNAGVRIFAVGVGSYINESELRLMTNNVFTAKDFDDLLKMTYQIAQRTCEGIVEKPVDGSWSSWQEWNTCVPQCGGGRQTRQRACTKPSPAHGGRQCPGVSSETRACNQQPCIGEIKCTTRADIGFVMDASASIGERDFQKERDFVKALAGSFNFAPDQTLVGVITYSDDATIDIPLGRYMSPERFKLAVDQIPYILGRTRIDKAIKLAATGIFSEQGGSRPGYPKLMIILTDGVQTRDPDAIPLDQAVIPLRNAGVRILAVGVGSYTNESELRLMTNNVFTANDFDDLLKMTYQIAQRTCETLATNNNKVNGDWSSWSRWSTCSVTCGAGIYTRQRRCDNPAPSNGGYPCSGPRDDSRSCHKSYCRAIVNGVWSSWSRWSACSVTCGTGIHARQRRCDNPAPSNGGYPCSGPREESRSCHKASCRAIVNGDWSSWSRWSTCSVACGTGIRARQRRCDNPAPSNGGYPCPGPREERRSCQEASCRVNGGWSLWARWSVCSASCDGGVQSRQRRCDNPVPSHRGYTCSGSNVERRACNQASCIARIVDGQWTPWRNWQPCSRSCGGGVQSRYRACSNPPPSSTGRGCYGHRRESRLCNSNPCQVSTGCRDIDGRIGFLMVSSRSIGNDNFRKQREFVKKVAASYGITREGTRAGLIRYGDNAQIYAKLGDHTDTRSFNNVVDSIPYNPGQTRIDKALRTAAYTFFPSSGVVSFNVPRILILITDGRQSIDYDVIPLSQAVIPLRIANVRIFVIGVGDRVDERELNILAENGRDVFIARDFDELLRRSGEVTRKSCAGFLPKRKPPCLGMTDLAFLLDASGSIGRENFEKQRQFVTTMSSSFTVAPSLTHVGVMTYSSFSTIRIRFSDYYSINQIRQAMANVPFTRGQGRIDKALSLAKNDLFTVSGGARWGVPKVAVILSDGVQAQSVSKLREAAETLYRAGIKILAVGIGIEANELRNLVESENDIITVRNFDDLLRRAHEIALRTCDGVRGPYPVPPTNPVPGLGSCPYSMDLGFALDSSSELGTSNYLKEKEFIKKIGSSIGLSNRVGVLVYGDTSLIEIKIKQHSDAASFRSRVNRLPFYSQRRRIDKALLTANLMFKLSKQDKKIAKVFVLLVGGKQTITRHAVSLRRAVQPLSRAGVKIIVIGVGRVSPNELRVLSKHIFLIPSFDILLTQVDIFKRIICEAATTSPRIG